jgi:hypothetical protein
MTTFKVGKLRFLIALKVKKMIKLKAFAILLCLVNLTYAQEVKDTTYQLNNSYVIRVKWYDEIDNINFYGISVAGFYINKVATYSGLTLGFNLGQGKLYLKDIEYDITVNGLNVSLLNTGTNGKINGISIATLTSMIGEFNGIAFSGTGGVFNNLNGLFIGAACGSSNANALQVGAFMNMYCRFNGIGIGIYNTSLEAECESRIINGLIIGVINVVDVNGLSIGLVNNGNSWLQIGVVNMGDSTVQIGLVNLDENKKMGIPIININF